MSFEMVKIIMARWNYFSSTASLLLSVQKFFLEKRNPLSSAKPGCRHNMTCAVVCQQLVWSMCLWLCISLSALVLVPDCCSFFASYGKSWGWLYILLLDFECACVCVWCWYVHRASPWSMKCISVLWSPFGGTQQWVAARKFTAYANSIEFMYLHDIHPEDRR